MENKNQKKHENIYESGMHIRESYSAKAVTTGLTSVSFFDGKDEQLGTSYQRNGANTFRNGKGSLLEISASIVGPDGAQADLTDSAVVNAINKVIHAATLEIQRATLPVHVGYLKNFMQRPPMVLNKATPDATKYGPSVAIAAIGPHESKTVFKNPIRFANSDTLETYTLTTVAIPAALNNHIIVLSRKTLEVSPPSQK